MTEVAVFKAQRQPEFVAIFKVKSEHFAIFENNILKRCIRECCKAEVAIDELTRNKFYLRQADVRQITSSEAAIFIFAFCQAFGAEVFLVKGLVVDVMIVFHGQIKNKNKTFRDCFY